MLKNYLLKTLGFVAALIAILPTHAWGSYYCDPCYETNQGWMQADYLFWQIQDSPKVIPLIIEQPLADGPFDVVLGGKKIKGDWRSGGRFALGYWFDDCKSLGAEASYFFLGKKSKHSSVASDENGSPRMRVPYFDVTTGLPDSTALSTPGIFRGEASLRTSNEMQGAELNLVSELPCFSFRLLAGFRYLNFKDSLTFSVDSPLVNDPTDVYHYRDKFHTQNNFYGGQIGAYFRKDFSCFFFDATGKVALGAMYQESTIKGFFQTNEFSDSVETFEGGFFALPTNIGRHKKSRFSVIPELNINLGYQITDCLSLRVGYSVLYVTEIVRASKQMSSALNPTQSANIDFTPTPILEGEPVPTGKLKSSSLWAQGVNVGLEFIF